MNLHLIKLQKSLAPFYAFLARIVFTFIVLVPAISVANSTNCTDLLKTVPGSYNHYVEKSEAARGPSKEKHPEYLNPATERALAKLWKGEVGPKLLQSMLPPGVTFVGHQLRKASAPGVVKVESGDLVILRVDLPFEGKTISTNVTVNAQALFKNIERSLKGEPLWLIGPEAKAAMDWGHGGGTKTTGGHTADTLMNYMSKYDVFTVGMDQPWHGEGPRHWFENEEEYFRFRVAFRNHFIHPDVPTFLVGHSKGGLVADMALRRTGKGYESIGLDKAYVGMIPLSFVADINPGADFEGKTSKQRAIDIDQKAEEIMRRMNPGDLSLFANLMAQDKTSALSGLFCSMLSIFNEWNLKSAPCLPSLYVMGEHDALYVLYEQLMEKHVRLLPGAKLWTFSTRVTFRGEVEQVGHMIFDHYMPKKNHPEANAVMKSYLEKTYPKEEFSESEAELQSVFRERVLKGHVNELAYLTEVNTYSSTLVLMAYQWVPGFNEFLENRIASFSGDLLTEKAKAEYFLGYTDKGVFETYTIIKDFVAQVLGVRGVEMPEVSIKQRMTKLAAAGDPLANQRETVLSVFKAYANNLAFREFLDDFAYFDMGATPKFEFLNKISGEVTQRIKIINAIQKDKNITDEQKVQKINDLHVINDEYGQPIALADVAAYEKVGGRIHEIRNKNFIPEGKFKEMAAANVAERMELHAKAKELEKVRDGLKKQLDQIKNAVSEKQKIFDGIINHANSAAIQDFESRREALFAELESFDFKLRDVQEAFLAKILMEGKSLAKEFDNLPPELLTLFQETEAASQRYQALLKEGEELRLSEALDGSFGPQAKALAIELSEFSAQAEELYTRLSHVDYVQLGALFERRDQLMVEYIENIVPEYFKIAKVKVFEALNQEITSLDQAREIFRYAEKAWSHWRSKILTSKPEAGKSELY